jgi:CheY-like chemotaxis protein
MNQPPAEPTEPTGMIRMVEILDSVVKQWREAGHSIKPTILVIDDDETVLTAVQLCFQRLGCAVEVARSGDEGVDKYRARLAGPYWQEGASRHPYDLIFLDLNMPGMDGPTVLRLIKGANAEQPVAILTGHASQYDLNELMEIGYIGLVNKPVTLDNLDTILAAHNLQMRISRTE